MSRATTLVLRYLEEAHATELALQRELETQIAMTPASPYRDDLERHLRETRDHAERVQRRAKELGLRRDPVRMGFGLVQGIALQALTLSRGPLVLLRGRGGEEKLLKNAKDSAAAEALEIATYTAIERLATSVDDTQTARLAASIRRDEERMLEAIRRHLATLTDDVARAQLHDDPSYDPTRTGAADAAREVADTARATAKKARSRTRSAGSSAQRKAKETGQAARRRARSVPGATRIEGEARGFVASASDLPIAGYDELSADEIVKRLPELSQVQLGVVDGYERRHADRTTVLDRVRHLQGSEPWAGYDEQTAAEIRGALSSADDETRQAVREYERTHKSRQGVLAAAERSTAGAAS